MNVDARLARVHSNEILDRKPINKNIESAVFGAMPEELIHTSEFSNDGSRTIALVQDDEGEGDSRSLSSLPANTLDDVVKVARDVVFKLRRAAVRSAFMFVET